MKERKKGFLALCLAVCMMLTFVCTPEVAFADNDSVIGWGNLSEGMYLDENATISFTSSSSSGAVINVQYYYYKVENGEQPERVLIREGSKNSHANNSDTYNLSIGIYNQNKPSWLGDNLNTQGYAWKIMEAPAYRNSSGLHESELNLLLAYPIHYKIAIPGVRDVYDIENWVGNARNPEYYTVGEGITSDLSAVPSDLVLEGHEYEFKGWYRTYSGAVSEGRPNDYVPDPVSAPALPADTKGNVTFYAKFLPKYTITYELNGGSWPANSNKPPESYTKDDAIDLSRYDVPEPEGYYDFDGWYDNAGFTGRPVTEIPEGSTGNKTLYAKFSGWSSHVDFHFYLDGRVYDVTAPGSGVTVTGDVDLDDFKYTYGTERSLPDVTKEGYTLDGWYYDDEFSGTPVTTIPDDYAPVVTYDGVKYFSEVINLYARFVEESVPAETFTISYDMPRGAVNGSGNPEEYTEGDVIQSLSPASLEGSEFKGWFKDAGYKNAVGTPGTPVIGANDSGNKTFYAKFEKNTTPDPNPDPNPNPNPDPNPYPYPSAYAIDYELGFDDAENDETNPTSYIPGIIINELKEATKENYDFVGWYTDEELETPVGSPVIDYTDKGNKIFYAKFEPKKWAISYELNGGINGEGNPEEYTYTVGLQSITPASYEGYSFAGWYEDPEMSVSPAGLPAIAKDATGDKTFYAKFTPMTWGITYELDGGVNDEANPDVHTYGVSVDALKAASKEGYSFEGWFIDPDCTVPAGTPAIAAKDMGFRTFYAKFVKIEEPEPAPAPVSEEPDYIPVYRFFNPTTGEHLFTADKKEKDALKAAGWNDEGVAFRATVNGYPVYRLFNEKTGEHYYAAKETEINKLVAEGWVKEGIAFRSADADCRKLIRLTNTQATSFAVHYSAVEAEIKELTAVGWIKEETGIFVK